MQAHGIVALLALAGVAPTAALWTGPSNCVSLTRSSGGSCVITTACKGVDIDNFEFALDCWNPPDDLVRHSFGFGGFDAEEEFDTEVKCQRCEAPAPAGAQAPPEAATSAAPGRQERLMGFNAQAKAERPHPWKVRGPSAPVAAEAPVMNIPQLTGQDQVKTKPDQGQVNVLHGQQQQAKVLNSQGVVSAVGQGAVAVVKEAAKEKYGPGKCVSTWKDPESSHCIMQTKCSGQDMSQYEYGLMCIDKQGAPMKHLFGKGSFDPEETFDTLISCAQCLGTDGTDGASSDAVGQLKSDVRELKTDLSKMAASIEKLNMKVFGKSDLNLTNGTKANETNGTPNGSFIHVQHVQLRGNQGNQHSHHRRKHGAKALKLQPQLSPSSPVTMDAPATNDKEALASTDQDQQEAPQPTQIVQNVKAANVQVQQEVAQVAPPATIAVSQDVPVVDAQASPGVDPASLTPEEEELSDGGAHHRSLYGVDDDN